MPRPVRCGVRHFLLERGQLAAARQRVKGLKVPFRALPQHTRLAGRRSRRVGAVPPPQPQRLRAAPHRLRRLVAPRLLGRGLRCRRALRRLPRRRLASPALVCHARRHSSRLLEHRRRLPLLRLGLSRALRRCLRLADDPSHLRLRLCARGRLRGRLLTRRILCTRHALRDRPRLRFLARHLRLRLDHPPGHLRLRIRDPLRKLSRLRLQPCHLRLVLLLQLVQGIGAKDGFVAAA